MANISTSTTSLPLGQSYTQDKSQGERVPYHAAFSLFCRLIICSLRTWQEVINGELCC